MKPAIGRAMLLGGSMMIAGAAPAMAQGTSNTQSSRDPNTGLGDIVVTATRRAEASQSIPVAITAVSADSLKSAAVTDLQGLTKSLVGVQYDTGTPQRPELSIRGIYTNRFDIGSNPSSGVYVDEVYQSRFADTFTGLVDVDRIEVLRGPQGTLFGRNTIGGAISIFTADPGKEFGGQISGTYGNLNLVDLKGNVTVPISEKVSSRFAFGYRDRDGFMHDIVSGKNDGQQTITFRGKIVAELTDDLTLKVAGSYYRNDVHAMLGNPVAPSLILQGPQRGFAPDGDPFHGAYTFPGYNHLRKKDLNARLIWDNDQFQLTAIASWIGFRQDPRHDLDAAPNDTLSYAGRVRSNTYSGELRFASTDGGFATFGDRFKWVAGIYLYQDKGSEVADLRYGADSSLANTEHNNSGRVGYVTADKINTNDSDLTSIAIYGQGTFDITDKLGLTIGGRYTRDKRVFTFTGRQEGPATFPQVVTPFSFSASPVDTAFNPKIGIEYHVTPSALLYATYSKGFKGGGTQSTANNLAQGSRITSPEKVDAYEIGAKTEFFNHRVRVNVSGFVNKYSDLQVRRVVRFSNGTVSAVSENAATARIRGVELESSVLVTPDFRINASYAYLHARYGSYLVDPTATPPITFDGHVLPRAPSNRFNVDANYTLHLSDENAVVLRASYSYTGSFYFQPDNLPAQKEPNYALIDASATFNLHDGNTSIQLWGRNLGNKTYRTYLDPLTPELIAYYGDKRTYGVTLSQKF